MPLEAMVYPRYEVYQYVFVKVDYCGFEPGVLWYLFQVTVENFIRVLTGRLPPSTPRSKRLLSDEHSNVLVYMTGRLLMDEFCLKIVDGCIE